MQIQDGGRTTYWIFFWLYLGAILADQREIWNRDEGSHADIGHVTKTAIFANSRWRRAAILKIALYPYLSRNYTISSKFGMPMQIYIPSMEIWQKIEIFNRNFSNSRWRTDAILKIVFWLYLAIGALSYWPIDAKFGKEMKNHMPIQVTWPKLQFSQIQDGGRPPFWKQFSVFTSFL